MTDTIKISQLDSDAFPSINDLIPLVDISGPSTKQTSVLEMINLLSTGTDGWTNLPDIPSSITYNGNHSYTLVYSSVDITGLVSNKMRLRFTRSTASPIQCTSLNGSTQYYSKSSPTGMTFTNNFVVSAYIKLSAYSASNQVITSRYNGTSGWSFLVTPSGQVELVGFNAGSSNFSSVTSNQNIPLNKWVHVTGELDMSSFTYSSTTSYIMFDCVDVGGTVARGGTNPTALVQAGNLEVGSTNGGTLLFNGKIAQVAIYSAKITQSTIANTISQSLSGTETNLISAYSFNNSISDLNTNANNLTANGSAVATNADSPFSLDDADAPTGTTDYGIVMSRVFSTDTTLVVQVPEGNTIPTIDGLSTNDYSVAGVPFGFRSDESAWTVVSICPTDRGISGSSYATMTDAINIPPGSWRLIFKASIFWNDTSTTTPNGAFSLSSSGTTETNPSLTIGIQFQGSSAASTIGGGAVCQTETAVKFTSATTFTLIGKVSAGNLKIMGATGTPTVFRAVNAYL